MSQQRAANPLEWQLCTTPPPHQAPHGPIADPIAKGTALGTR
ncbi:MAG: hypothetical protein ACAF42_04075 [Limnothrix sp. BL-A-16]